LITAQSGNQSGCILDPGVARYKVYGYSPDLAINSFWAFINSDKTFWI